MPPGKTLPQVFTTPLPHLRAKGNFLSPPNKKTPDSFEIEKIKGIIEHNIQKVWPRPL